MPRDDAAARSAAATVVPTLMHSIARMRIPGFAGGHSSLHPPIASSPLQNSRPRAPPEEAHQDYRMTLAFHSTEATLMVFAVTLDAGTSMAMRDRFFRGMRRQMRERLLIMSQSHGLCMLLATREDEPRRHRRAVVTWLIDEPLVRQVAILPTVSLIHAIREGFAAFGGAGLALPGRKPFVAERLLRRLLAGVLVQGIQDLRFWERH
jgi:hypothetical protein